MPQPPTMLLQPGQRLPPLPDSLTQAQQLEAWLDDVERYNVLLDRYEAWRAWYGRWCVKNDELAQVLKPAVE